MKTWDLVTGMKKMGLALDSLNATAADVTEYWNDDANRKFREAYVEPLGPKVRIFIDSVQRLADVLDAAERECGIIQ